MSEPRVGDRVLVDITCYGATGQLRDRRLYAGVMRSVERRRLWIQPDGTDGLVALDAAPDDLIPAPSGTYRLSASGPTITAPHWIASWVQADEASGSGFRLG
jgi:hypothetical protein